jgi:hypothetical protein
MAASGYKYEKISMSGKVCEYLNAPLILSTYLWLIGRVRPMILSNPYFSKRFSFPRDDQLGCDYFKVNTVRVASSLSGTLVARLVFE